MTDNQSDQLKCNYVGTRAKGNTIVKCTDGLEVIVQICPTGTRAVMVDGQARCVPVTE
ncbi:hypothetical protein OG308_15925 [Nocardia salmonicida]|uniref:Uncharacterized protein n=1 Tax=Nocardia salmonicida TaxID=53431 RepID=A0ABZ1NHK2_9NOCA